MILGQNEVARVVMGGADVRASIGQGGLGLLFTKGHSQLIDFPGEIAVKPGSQLVAIRKRVEADYQFKGLGHREYGPVDVVCTMSLALGGRPSAPSLFVEGCLKGSEYLSVAVLGELAARSLRVKATEWVNALGCDELANQANCLKSFDEYFDQCVNAGGGLNSDLASIGLQLDRVVCREVVCPQVRDYIDAKSELSRMNEQAEINEHREEKQVEAAENMAVLRKRKNSAEEIVIASDASVKRLKFELRESYDQFCIALSGLTEQQRKEILHRLDKQNIFNRIQREGWLEEHDAAKFNRAHAAMGHIKDLSDVVNGCDIPKNKKEELCDMICNFFIGIFKEKNTYHENTAFCHKCEKDVNVASDGRCAEHGILLQHPGMRHVER